jgi:hypothetical protein
MWSLSDGSLGVEWFFVVLGFFFDIASYGSGSREQRRRSRDAY